MCYNTPIATSNLTEQIVEATFILNIGLNTTDGAITIEEARKTLRAYGFSILREALLESDTEPTLVAEVATGFATTLTVLQLLYQVSEELKQDCIAVYRELTGGALVGPRADAWGPFNPEYFLLLDGRRLSEVNAN